MIACGILSQGFGAGITTSPAHTSRKWRKNGKDEKGTKMFKFEHIVKYKQADERIRQNNYESRYYYNTAGHSRDGDMLIRFTVVKYAEAEDQHNQALLLERARSLGAQYLIQGQRGPQIIIPGFVDGAAGIFNDYREELTDTWEQTDNRYYGYADIRSFNSNSATAVSCRGYRRLHGHVMPGVTGVYDVTTGRKITGRQNILKKLWELGFLGDRGVVLYAADYCDGSPADVEMYKQIKPRIRTLTWNSPLVKGLATGMNKISKACDWPQEIK